MEKNHDVPGRQRKIQAGCYHKAADEEHQPIISWSVSKAWPCKVQYSELKADVNEILIETMELVHEGLSIVEAKNDMQSTTMIPAFHFSVVFNGLPGKSATDTDTKAFNP